MKPSNPIAHDLLSVDAPRVSPVEAPSAAPDIVHAPSVVPDETRAASIASAAPVRPEIEPFTVQGVRTLWYLLRFLRDPIVTGCDLTGRHGRLIVIEPFAGFPRRQIVVAVGAGFNRTVLGAPRIWQTRPLTIHGPDGSALRRLGDNIVSLNGPRQAYYRKLLSQPIRAASVDEMGDDIGRVVTDHVASWSYGRADFWLQAKELMRSVAVGLLFSGDQERGAELADLLERLVLESKSAQVQLFRKAWPGSTYSRMLRRAETIERCTLAMAKTKRGETCQRDLVSLIVNSPDETGAAPSNANIAGQIPVLFAASYETCQTVLNWCVFLLAQHPRVARDLVDEVVAGLAGAPLSLSRVARLPLLDAVVRESMRILPPVPFQVRFSSEATRLGGHDVAPETSVMLSSLLTNREPTVYDEPARFLPERWSRINPSAFEYMVFSGGPRICPGSWFGVAVVKVALAAILSRFRVNVVPDTRIDFRAAITLRPRNGLPVVLQSADGRWATAPLTGSIRDLVDMSPR